LEGAETSYAPTYLISRSSVSHLSVKQIPRISRLKFGVKLFARLHEVGERIFAGELANLAVEAIEGLMQGILRSRVGTLQFE